MDHRHAMLKESAPYHAVANEVRRENKRGFEPRRAELRKTWPQFEAMYDDYRRWRDAPPNEADKYAAKGMKAQREIMKRSGVAGSGECELYDLLEANPSLLRFVSPINGDFRAPGQGLIAGLRFTDTPQGKTPTLAFPGTGSGSMIRAQMRTNISQFIGGSRIPPAHRLGIELAAAVRQALNSVDAGLPPLAFTGHSLGGAIASVAAAVTAQPPAPAPKCYLFNPAALGGGVRKALNTLGRVPERVAGQVIIRVKNDHVSSPAMQQRLAAVCTLITGKYVTVPRHLGQVHVVNREMLAPADRGLLALHKLESLSSVYAKSHS